MGVRGLNTFLKSYGFGTSQLVPGAELLVDGFALVGYIINSLEEEQKHSIFHTSYDEIHRKVAEHINLLRDEMKFDLTVYFDGNISRLKDGTFIKRRLRKIAAWHCIQDLCISGDCSDYNSVWPTLCVEQLKQTLVFLRVKCVRCDEEVDQYIALLCQEKNRNILKRGGIDERKTCMCYCYSLDSDFMVMKDCKYIEIGLIHFGSSTVLESCDTDVRPLQAVVWERKKIAEKLNMSERKFMECCILCGNDFTGHFDKVLMTDASKTQFRHKPGFEHFVKWIKQQPKGYCLSVSQSASEYTSINQAICFSRCFYELQDLASFPIDNCSDAPADPRSLTTEEGNEILIWLCSHYSELVSKVCDPSLLANDSSSSKSNTPKKSNKTTPKSSKKTTPRRDKFIFVNEIAIHFVTDKMKQNLKIGVQSDVGSHPHITSVKKHHVVAYHEMRKVLKKRSQASAVTSGDPAADTSLSPLSLQFSSLSLEDELAPVQSEVSSSSTSPPSVSTDVQTKATADISAVPEWQDFIASAYFENVIREMLRHLDKCRFENENCVEPRFNFDAPLFLRISKGSKLRDVPESVTSERENKKLNIESGLSSVTEDDGTTNIATNPATTSSSVLPIDAHKDAILEKISRDRVTIIHGETGCGKSSRLPAMLLEEAEKNNRPCKLMVSQPRRIAALSLMNRLRESHGNKVGMRMGHGVRDEATDTKIFFVTTGYLVRYLAHYPEAFTHHTHVIVDEVHERSVDGDVLCFLCRSLLASHPTIKIILMSATMHTTLFKTYFNPPDSDYGDLECLSVGVRRFPVTTFFLDEIMSGTVKGGTTKKNKLMSLATKLFDLPFHPDAVSPRLLTCQVAVALELIKVVAVKGSSLLIFVSGFNAIETLMEELALWPDSDQYKVLPLHSDVSDEDQMLAFRPAEDFYKIVVATNIAESSITLPDVDTVICFGTAKALKYNETNHCSQLAECWIPKDSATQRAGRTGRVRPGTVYRCYPKSAYDQFSDHATSEVHRKPLQDVILGLRAMLEGGLCFEGVLPVLQELPEPPQIDNIEKSFTVLHSAGMTTLPTDHGQLTVLGRFAGQLGLDLQLCRLIAFGIALGIPHEAVVIAAALSLDKMPYRTAVPVIHTDPDELNDIVRTTFMGKLKFDQGTYSQPICLLRLLVAYQQLGKSDLSESRRFLVSHGIVFARFKNFCGSASSLFRSVKKLLPHDASLSIKEESSLKFPSNETINKIRLIILWTSSDNLIRLKPRHKGVPTDCIMELSETDGEVLRPQQLNSLIPSTIPFHLSSKSCRIFDGAMTAARSNMPLSNVLLDLLTAFCQSRLEKFNGDKDIDEMSIICIASKVQKVAPELEHNNICFLLVALTPKHSVSTKRGALLEILSQLYGEKLQRISGQALGRFVNITESFEKSADGHQLSVTDCFVVQKPSAKAITNAKNVCSTVESSLYMLYPKQGSHPKITCHNIEGFTSFHAVLVYHGSIYHSDSDSDNFAAASAVSVQVIKNEQSICFDDDYGKAVPPLGNCCVTSELLSNDVCVGVRLINAAKNLYKTRTLLLPKPKDDAVGDPGRVVPGSEEWARAKASKEGVRVRVPSQAVKLSNASPEWVRLSPDGSGQRVLLDRASLESVACPLSASVPVFGCANTTLVVVSQGGSLVVCEGVTLLPVGIQWTSLALHCMDADVDTSFLGEYYWMSTEEEELCEIIEDGLSDLKTSKIMAKKDVIDAIHRLFEDWSGEPEELELDAVTPVVQPSSLRKLRKIQKKSSNKGKSPKS